MAAHYREVRLHKLGEPATKSSAAATTCLGGGRGIGFPVDTVYFLKLLVFIQKFGDMQINRKVRTIHRKKTQTLYLGAGESNVGLIRQRFLNELL